MIVIGSTVYDNYGYVFQWKVLSIEQGTAKLICTSNNWMQNQMREVSLKKLKEEFHQ